MKQTKIGLVSNKDLVHLTALLSQQNGTDISLLLTLYPYTTFYVEN